MNSLRWSPVQGRENLITNYLDSNFYIFLFRIFLTTLVNQEPPFWWNLFFVLRHLFYFNLSNYDGLGPLTFLTRCIINYIYTRSWRDSRVYIQTGWQHAQPPGPPHTHLFIFFVTVFFHQKNHDIYAENELILVKCSGLNWIGKHIFKSTFLFSTAVPSKLCMNYIIKFVMYRNNQNQTLVKLENE